MALRNVIVSFIAAASLGSGAVAAQASDSVPFHRGQWGAEFNIANGFFGVGALHFTSPTHAWLATLDASYAQNHATGPALASFNAGSAALELGTRSFHAFSRRLQRLTTFGTSFTYSRQTNAGGATFQALGAGVFADLGATWLVTPHLGIGARWRAGASYSHGRVSGGGLPTSTIDSWSVSLGSVLLTGQLYF
jgi:hypothetical protein